LEEREGEPTIPNAALTGVFDLDDDECGRIVEGCGCSLGDVPSTSSDVPPVKRRWCHCWPQRTLMVSKNAVKHPSWACLSRGLD